MDYFLIDGMPAKVLNVNIAITSYSKLLDSASGVNEFTISFITPTMLRSPQYYIKVVRRGDRHIPVVRRKERRRVVYLPIPQPNLLFKSVLRQFRKFSGIESFPYENVLAFIESDGIILKGFPRGIRTKVVRPSPDEYYIGFVGDVAFGLEDESSKSIARYIGVLLKYCEYCGVGAGRTAGLGWVKVRVAS